MIRTLAVSLAALVLSAASAQEPQAKASAATDGTRNCIDLSAVTSRQAEDGQTIRFEAIGGRTYRNHLPGRCPGLQQSSRGFGTLAFEVHGAQICRGDRVRVLDPSSPASVSTSVPCVLGTFTEVRTPAR
ncbi:hypothetical protein RCO27_13040 [Sphingosinicella sp. LHD-64]|uniref:hypothetical protein n=1 Tax=Sphingosinicella sp. LHD-64 TaxID=3072139 RepID=UPI00280FE08F|nr:hypothetical protein [Sphingosinicella sp. LHD-64]MDQ8757150.1 hypothetical protein [Sphingosinicella sp. LHD-64]